MYMHGLNNYINFKCLYYHKYHVILKEVLNVKLYFRCWTRQKTNNIVIDTCKQMLKVITNAFI